MFTQHPLDSEFFNLDDFIDENLSILRNMYHDAVDAMTEKQPEVKGDERNEMISVLLAVSILDHRSDIGDFPISYRPEHEKLIEEIGNGLLVLVYLFAMEADGLLKSSGDKWQLSEEGKMVFETGQDGI
jgi:hypothetical protein